MADGVKSSFERFQVALDWLDCLIEREVLRLRGRYELSLDELRGLYVSDARVDALLRERLAAESDTDPAATLSAHARALHARLVDTAPLGLLRERLALRQAEIDVVCLALALEVDLRYEPLYAYLNNDALRKYLTIDLACRLLADSSSGDTPARDEIRALLAPRSRLVTLGVVEAVPSAERRSSLHEGFVVAPVVAQALLALPVADPRWPPEVRWLTRIELPAARERHDQSRRRAPLHVLSGDEARELQARAVELACRHDLPLIALPASALVRDAESLRSVRLAARLVEAAVVIDAHDTGEEVAAAAVRAARELASDATPVILLTTGRAALGAALAEVPHRHVEVEPPRADERAALWVTSLARAGIDAEGGWVEHLAETYALTAARIDAAAQSVALREPGDRCLRHALDHEANARTNEALARLATRVVRPHDWSHLVLPDPALQQLREITNAIESRDRVYRRWGMGERNGGHNGLMIFFSGASGTGKTMAAAVIANSVGLELYRIDLASVVSKYIGETEKNLERIFTAAHRSSAILFFDEADALLGRRSEIKDAHDRYANIEVAYLLQKMEEHDGVVILASNLPKNLDPAFERRMHYLLEFARPNAVLRERLWRGMFPAATPLDDDIDFRFLAERFETTGGVIRAIALDAAFLAAAERSSITMRHLMRAMTRRQTKQGDSGGWARYREHRAAASEPTIARRDAVDAHPTSATERPS